VPVSSDYSIFCLSHDPAIEVSYDHSVGEVAELVTNGLAEHPACDLLLARYSGALIELGCPAMGNLDSGARRPHGGWHRDTVWAGAGLLRVVAAVIETEADGHADVLTKSLKRVPMCWTVERLHRLRHVLEVAL
jgi:hypothetical protein